MAVPDWPVLSLYLLQLLINIVWDWHQSWGAIFSFNRQCWSSSSSLLSQPLGTVLNFYFNHLAAIGWPNVNEELPFDNSSFICVVKNNETNICGEDPVGVLLRSLKTSRTNLQENLSCSSCSAQGQSFVLFLSHRLLKWFTLDHFGGCSLTEEQEVVYFAADLNWLNDILTSWLEEKHDLVSHHHLIKKDLVITNFSGIPDSKVWLMTSVK